MKRVLLIFVMIVSISLCSFANEVMEKTEKITLKKHNELELKNVSGDIAINVWNKNEISINYKIYNSYMEENIAKALDFNQLDITKADELLNEVKVYIEKTRKKIRISSKIPKALNNCTIDYVIYIPEKLSNLKLNYVNSKVKIKSFDGDIEINSVNGNINIVAAKDIFIKTSNANTDIKNMKGSLDIISVGGNIVVGTVGKNVKIKTVNGNIDIQAVNGKADLATINGNIDVDEINRLSKINNINGNINIRKVKTIGTVKSLNKDIHIGE